MALALVWLPGPNATGRLYLAAAMAAIVYVAFFVALFAMPLYGGRAFDDNGYLPFAAPVPVIAKRWDGNIVAFSAMAVLVVAGTLTVAVVS